MTGRPPFLPIYSPQADMWKGYDVNDVMYEGRQQHRGLRPLLFSNSGVGSFTSHKNQISVSAVRRDLRFFLLIRED